MTRKYSDHLKKYGLQWQSQFFAMYMLEKIFFVNILYAF